ncbi:MAG: thioesterase family protein [Pelagibacteraceae bacterium]|jgi:acyl-CoA thioester hydrolase|nr:MAG: thioesterase [Pseudomonadota bacterium]|tara:strand:- start:234 stop:704 length:471 start_codon:yes stop_codon:yes gene_type:complete
MSVHLSSQKIIKDWIDYNDHMNVAYYLLIFDKFGADNLNRIFKMGEESAKNTGMSTMIVETNITYNQELKLDDEVDINLLYFDHDKKRLQYKMEMINKKEGYLASTFEALALYVNLNTRKVSEFEEEKLKIMNEFINKNQSSFVNENLKFSSKLKK